MSQDVVRPADGSARDEAHVSPSLAVLLAAAEHALRTELHPTLSAEGLSFEHWRILSVLAAQPGQRMTDIGIAAVVPATSLTRHMDQLVERALVVRRIDPEDKRRVVAALSSRGTELASRLHREERGIESALAARLGAERVSALVRDLSLALHLFD